MPHDDGAREESDDARESEQLPEQVSEVAVEQYKTGLLDRVVVEGLVDFEQVAETEPREGAKGNAKEEQVTEIQKHLLNYCVSKSACVYVN